MKMDIQAWRSEYQDVYEYKVQISNIKHGDKTTLSQLFKEWHISREGWNLHDKSEIKLLKKVFDSEKHWKEWAKKCPIKVVEYKYRAGKETLIQHSCKTRKKRAIKNATKK